MKKIIIATSIVLVYIGSCYYNYKFLQKKYYHPQGQWYNKEIKEDASDYMIVFFPFLNTFFGIIITIEGWKHSNYKSYDFFKPNECINK